MDDIEKMIKPALELIKGYAYGNKITREDLMAVLYLSRNFTARDMFKNLVSDGLIELINGDPRFPDKEDEYQISEKGFKLIGEE